MLQGPLFPFRVAGIGELEAPAGIRRFLPHVGCELRLEVGYVAGADPDVVNALPELLAIGVLAGFFAIGGIAACRGLRAAVSQRPKFLSATLAELRKDRTKLEGQ